MIDALVDAGASAFRLNFSHGDADEKRAKIAMIRAISQAREQPLAIVGDLGGPKLRTKDLAGGKPLRLEKGADVVITSSAALSSGNRIAVDYEELADDVQPGDRILFDDGSIEVIVDRIEGRDVHAIVKNGGVLSPRARASTCRASA